jgi:hypothetical protein
VNVDRDFAVIRHAADEDAPLENDD